MFSYVSSFKKHLQKSHSKSIAEDIEDHKWENYCRITKNGQEIEGHYKLYDSSLASNVFHIEGSNTNNKANFASMNGKVGNAVAGLKSKENKSNEISMHSMEGSLIEPTKRKRRHKDKTSNDQFTITSGREDFLSSLADSSHNPKKQTKDRMEGTIRQPANAIAPISSTQDIRNSINYKGIIPPNISMNEMDKSMRLENNTPKSVTSANRNKFVIERLNDQSSPKQTLTAKQNSLPASVSQEFTKKLEKVQINKNKLISITQPLKAINPIARNPHTLPTQPTNFVKLNHVHNEYCGHIKVIHRNHIDYLVNGELHYVDSLGRVYPHKLETSEINPVGCRSMLRGDFVNVEGCITEHV